MAFQLTISQTAMSAAEALRRKKVITVTGENATLGPEDATCPIPDFDRQEPLTITVTQEGRHLLRADTRFSLNHEPCTGKPQPIRSGDIITCGNWNVQFHVCHPKVKQSWKSSVLAHASQAAIACIMVTVIAAMFWLPAFLSANHSWGKQAAREELSLTLDEARKKVRKLDERGKLDDFQTLFLEQVSHELDSRVRYVRKHGPHLSAEQRNSLARDVRDLMAALDQVLEKGVDTTLPKPDLDQAVRKIIEMKQEAMAPEQEQEQAPQGEQ